MVLTDVHYSRMLAITGSPSCAIMDLRELIHLEKRCVFNGDSFVCYSVGISMAAVLTLQELRVLPVERTYHSVSTTCVVS